MPGEREQNRGVLSGRTALVTGAGAGMGRAHALRLAARGARVVVQDIRGAAANTVVAEIEHSGGFAQSLVCDVSDVATYSRALDDLVGQRGVVDILVNNAGISGASLATEEITTEVFDAMLGVNLRASFCGGQRLIPAMKAQRWGRIVNISSIFAIKGSPNAPHYTAAKAALLGLTKAWALELAPWAICVNAIAPGLVRTELTSSNLDEEHFDAARSRIPIGRLVSVDDVAGTVAFLVGPEGNAITGQTIVVSGGDTIA